MEPIIITINGVPWKVYEVPANNPGLTAAGPSTVGACHDATKEIYINCDLIPYFLRQTLIHELTHAHLREFMLKLSDRYDEEELCEFVAKYSERIIASADEFCREKDRRKNNE